MRDLCFSLLIKPVFWLCKALIYTTAFYKSEYKQPYLGLRGYSMTPQTHEKCSIISMYQTINKKSPKRYTPFLHG